MRSPTILTAWLLIALAVPAFGAADDAGEWPHLRGPNYDGRCAGATLAERWPASGPPVVWTREFGQGYSGFTAAGKRLFTQTQNLGGQFVVCLDSDTGETVWETRYDWPYQPLGIYPGPRATPTYSAGRVFYAAPSGTIGCLDAETGRLLWSVALKEKYRGEGSDFGYSISPTVFQGKVIVPVGGRGASVVALDVRDGKILWASGDEPASYVSAYPITLQGRELIVTLMQNSLSCFEPEDGKKLWMLEFSQGYDEHAAWPLYAEPYLMVCSPFRSGSKVYELSLEPDPRCTLFRTSDGMSNDVFSSLLIDGAVYGFDVKDPQAKLQRTTRGTLRCIDSKTGEQHWETDRVAYPAMLEADGKLILWTDLGELILARRTTEKYDELARAQILGGEITWTQPTLHRNRLYVRNPKRIACIELGEPLERGAGAATEMTAADIATAPVRDLTFLLAVDAEYAFDLPTGEWFRVWYVVSLLVMALAGAVVGIAWLMLRFGEPAAWWGFWSLAFVLGALATPLVGGWRQELTFTWPVCIFVMFQAWVYQGEWGRRGLVARPRLWSYLAGVLFLASCLVYFLLCKRLSLVFEWCYLTGFAPAIPAVLIGARFSRGKRPLLTGVLGTVTAFSAFYWGAVGILLFQR